MTTEKDQGLGWWEQYICGQQCESINSKYQKTRVIEDQSGVNQLWSTSARKCFENQRNILQQKTSDNIRISCTGSVGASNRSWVSDADQLKNRQQINRVIED